MAEIALKPLDNMDGRLQLEQHNIELRSENDRLAAENAELRERLNEAESRLLAYSSKNREKNPGGTNQRDDPDALHDQVRYLKTAMQRLSSENEQMRTEMQFVTEEKDELQSKLDREDKLLPEDVEGAIAQIRTQLKKKLQEKAIQNAVLERDNDSLQESLEETREETAILRGKLKHLNDERATLASKLEKLEKFNPEEVEEANRQIREQLKRKVQEKNGQYLELSLLASKLEEEKADLEETVEALQRQLVTMVNEKSEAQHALHDLRTRINENPGNVRRGSGSHVQRRASAGHITRLSRGRRASLR